MQIFANPRIEEVVVHDLRTPLNVLTLVLKMLERQPAAQIPELVDDLNMIRGSVLDLDRMLSCLVQTSRIPDKQNGLTLTRFDPQRLIDEVIAEHSAKPKATPVQFQITGDAPRELVLDEELARVALQLALANACSAASGSTVKVRLLNHSQRCVWRFEVCIPPRDTVQSHELVLGTFERIVGNPGERRGLDLAIPAQISALFGGSAWLEAVTGQNSVVILDWPTEITIENSQPETKPFHSFDRNE